MKKLVVKAFQGLPGPTSRLYMRCPTTGIKQFTKPSKTDLTLTNRRFNFDKFRVCIRLTCQTFGGSYQDYLGGVTYLMKAS